MNQPGEWMRNLLISGLFVSLAALVGCGDADPGGISDTPGPTPTSDGGSPTQRLQSGTGADDAATTVEVQDASIDHDPGYRDPRQADGGCESPNLICNGGGDAGVAACVAVTTDVDNCGQCGTQCVGQSASCIASQCSCTDVGFAYCTGGCTDTSSDVTNCGTCGNACGPNVTCVAGACVPDKG
ncbi:unnamed protein product [marine sediment metagenome]|uniref:Uncharacterized protein n=1 Tax=marine sediment metagenome TaxID=412755 RepID=X0UNK8_9ZZZZ